MFPDFVRSSPSSGQFSGQTITLLDNLVQVVNPGKLPAGKTDIPFQGWMLQNSISAENVPDKFSSSNFGHISTQNKHTSICLSIMNTNLSNIK
jgi:acetyl/propionyl-CoA carboxylase alpha subunit